MASERTIKRAFKNLGGESHSAGFPRVATWSLPSRDSRANASLGVNNRVPTGPTGDKQGKHNGPTRQKSQSGHGPHTGPTGALFALNTSNSPHGDDIEDAILDALDTTRGQSTDQIQKHLTKQQLDQAGDFYTIIEHLQMKGLIRINERGLYVRKETA